MRKTFLLLLLLIFATPVITAAQEICTLPLKEAPAPFGLTLEMSPAQVQAILGKKLKVKIKREGSFFQNFIEKPPPAFLSGVRVLYLRFFESKLYQIEIFYDNKHPNQTLSDFTQNSLAANFKLPVNTGKGTGAKIEISCPEFSLSADNVLNPRIELTHEAIRARFEESQKETAAKKKH